MAKRISMTERGKIIEIEIGRTIKFNDASYSKAFIEIELTLEKSLE